MVSLALMDSFVFSRCAKTMNPPMRERSESSDCLISIKSVSYDRSWRIDLYHGIKIYSSSPSSCSSPAQESHVVSLAPMGSFVFLSYAKAMNPPMRERSESSDCLISIKSVSYDRSWRIDLYHGIKIYSSSPSSCSSPAQESHVVSLAPMGSFVFLSYAKAMNPPMRESAF